MTLHHRSFASGSNAAVHAALEPAIRLEPLSLYQDGDEIYAQGEKAGNLYEVGFGCVRVYRLLEDGHRQIAAFHLPGEVFGFEASGSHAFFADAVGATGIRNLQSSDAGTAAKVLPLALESLVRAQKHLLVLGRQNAEERLTAFLADMDDRQGGIRHVELPMTRTDIADYLGLTIETVSRVLSRLRQRGIIRLSGLRVVEILGRLPSWGMN